MPKKHDDYVSGPHSYWIHFLAGLIAGALLGCYLFWNLSGSAVVDLLAIIITASVFAAVCGRWGERAWNRIADWLGWWFKT